MLNPMIRRGIVWLVLPVLLALFVAFVGTEAKAGVRAGDTPQVCNWTISNYGTNNGFYLVNNATHRVRLDYTQQVRRAPGCIDQWRGKVNIFCYAGVSPSNCTVNGYIGLWYNSDLWAYHLHSFDFIEQSTSWYVGWYDFPGVGGIQAKGYFESAEVGSTYYDVANGTYGGSKYCARSGPAIGGTVSC